ncbi:MAG: MFS transporter [Blautia sp.]|nr:MFS transporter [Blautia sp.]
MAFVLGLNITGIMPILSLVSEKYASYSTSQIQMLQTVHYALMMAGSLSIGYLTTRFTKKKIVLAGLLIVGLTGVFPTFVEGFWVLLICRVLIGFGFGIFSPMSTAIIAEFFPPEKRAGFMGLNVVGMGIGTMVCNLLGGFLAKNGLRYFYLIYLAAFLGALVVLLVLPETPVISGERASRIKLNSMVYTLSLMFFMHTLFINAYSTNISLYISGNITRDPGASGFATAVNAASAMVMGILFTKVVNRFRGMTLPFSIFCAAVGYASVLFIPGMAGVMVSSALCGVSLSCFAAMGAYLISVSVEEEAVAKASGVYTIIGGIGGLIAPLVLSSSAGLLGGNTPENQFRIAMAGMFLLGATVAVFLSGRKQEQTQD